MSELESTEFRPAPASAPTEGTALGVISIMAGGAGVVPGIGILFAILGLVLGTMAKNRAKRTGNSVGATLGILGMVMSSLTLVVAILLLFVAGGMIGLLGHPGIR